MNVISMRLIAATLALVGLGIGLLPVPSVVAQNSELNQAEQAAIRAAVEKAQGWVVQIETVGGLERVGETLLTNSRTSGTIIDEDGHIVTSLFGLVTQPSSILVTLPGGKRLPAKVIARDHNRMLALLKVEPDEPLAEPEIVPRDKLRAGQWTIALGKIFSAEDANLSVGVLSATDRVWGKAIQTDAKISPNNYGGPLIDIQGRVMGILTPLSPQDTGELAGVEWYDSGIGFAVPISDILPRLDVWKEGTDLRSGLLGVSLKGNDVIVDPPAIGAVRYNSPAQQAGIEAGDVIVKAAGTEIVRQAQLKHILGGLYAEDTVNLTVKRGEEQIEVELTLAGEL
ncbi:MAG: trypsin-like peptidase domain-containing protein, partial [Pirellulaceae bacterium]